MDNLYPWRLCDVLSLEDAAVLLAGYNPEEIDRCCNDTNFLQNYPGITPFRSALIGAVKAGTLKARIGYDAHVRQWDEYPGIGWGVAKDAEDGMTTIFFNKNPNWSQTLIGVEELKRWLTKRGWTSGFFFPGNEIVTEQEKGGTKTNNSPDPKDKNSKFFSPKLAATIEAWETLQQDHKLQDANAVVKAATDWLTENAERLSILWTDPKTGKAAPPKSTITSMAKIINWNDKGGVNKTP